MSLINATVTRMNVGIMRICVSGGMSGFCGLMSSICVDIIP